MTAVPGLCALISCTFTYPDNAKPIMNNLWNACNETDQCMKEIFNFTKVKGNKNDKKVLESRRIKMLESDLNTNNCSIIIKEIKAGDKKEYMFRVEGSHQNTYNHTVKITIQGNAYLSLAMLKRSCFFV